jgi:hypothetical protein
MTRPQPLRSEGVLINPHASIEEVHQVLERIEIALTNQDGTGDPALLVHREMTGIQHRLRLPTCIQ